MRTKYLACLLYCAAMLAQEGSTPAYAVYAGYYGVATMKATGCTVVSVDPFKLDLPVKDIDPFAGPAYSPPDIIGVRVRKWFRSRVRFF